MASSKPNPIQAVSTPGGFFLVRPGARFVVERQGEEHRGAWRADGEPRRDADETFTEGEARLLLPLLRELEVRAAGKGGRPRSEPTSPDGKLVDRACKRLGLSAVALAASIGAHQSVLSRARHGELPLAHREAILALLRRET